MESLVERPTANREYGIFITKYETTAGCRYPSEKKIIMRRDKKKNQKKEKEKKIIREGRKFIGYLVVSCLCI